MARPRVLMLRAPGTNSDLETVHAFEVAGAEVERVHVLRLLETPTLLHDFQVLCIPGGFSYGDDLSAGRIFGNQLRLHLADQGRRFRDDGKLVLGICNGFQVLVKAGLLDIDTPAGPIATLARNDSGHYEARWVEVVATPGNQCVFLRGLERLELPVAHAEGKFLVRDEASFATLVTEHRLALRYAEAGQPAPEIRFAPQVPFPASPNGASGDVAGMCDTTGRVFGLMPHPERYIDDTQHPNWTRRPRTSEPGQGLAMFQNAVAYFG